MDQKYNHSNSKFWLSGKCSLFINLWYIEKKDLWNMDILLPAVFHSNATTLILMSTILDILIGIQNKIHLKNTWSVKQRPTMWTICFCKKTKHACKIHSIYLKKKNISRQQSSGLVEYLGILIHCYEILTVSFHPSVSLVHNTRTELADLEYQTLHTKTT